VGNVVGVGIAVTVAACSAGAIVVAAMPFRPAAGSVGIDGTPVTKLPAGRYIKGCLICESSLPIEKMLSFPADDIRA